MFWTIVLLFTIGLLYYKAIHEPLRHWKRKKVRQEKMPIPLFGDNFRALVRLETFYDLVRRLYSDCGNERYYGMYQMQLPVLFIKDLELIKQVTVKDFDHFSDHRSFVPEGIEPIWKKNLFSLKGDIWHDMRATLSPAFTSSKMKSMFTLMNECAEQFAKFHLEKNENEITLEMKDIFTRYTSDVIATCAFGIQVDSLKEPNNEFYLMGKEATNFSGFWKNTKFFLYFLCPTLSKILKVRVFSQIVTKFFSDIVKDTLKTREEHNIVRPDMIHLLMEARKGRLVHDDGNDEQNAGFATVQESNIGKVQKAQKAEITDVDITAQALIFFFAGFDTVSTLMSFMAYELAINPDIQEKLIAEVDETRNLCKGKINYDELMKMKYLDMVISETLRRWPPGVAVDRICTKPYTIQPVTPEESPVTLNCGDSIWIPITGLHFDPEYFPNPYKFDPERFSDENKHNIKPFTYVPFGVGPRNCIASRFALLETKVVIYNILSHFNFTVVAKSQVPIKIKNAVFNLSTERGIWLGLKKRS